MNILSLPSSSLLPILVAATTRLLLVVFWGSHFDIPLRACSAVIPHSSPGVVERSRDYNAGHRSRDSSRHGMARLVKSVVHLE